MCLYYISLVFFVCMSKALLSGVARTSAWLCLLAPLASWVEKVKSKAPSPVGDVFDQELLSTFLTVGGQYPALWQPCLFSCLFLLNLLVAQEPTVQKKRLKEPSLSLSLFF